MTLTIESERVCEAVIGYSPTTNRRIKCADVALYLCSKCGMALCEIHAAECDSCNQSFCLGCDHTCTAVRASSRVA
jgi:hypothetical protein